MGCVMLEERESLAVAVFSIAVNAKLSGREDDASFVDLKMSDRHKS
jgi:hypothetical protein